MTEDRRTRVEQLFLRARELPADQRAAFLARACDDDDALRAEIEDLLAHDRESFLHTRAFATPEAEDAGRPERIGAYRILEPLGEGGMGTVFLAEQREPVQRLVALKLIKLGMDTAAVLRRFELERRALALMNHDNIARVYDAGQTERGQPYFVMEHVPGVPITDYCDKHRLSIADRIALFQQVCQGIQHAHQKGVIHRDLKPGNVLVVRDGERAVPKIIDFGLARATDHRILAQTLFTEQGQFFGTPEYMSPEQANLDAEGIDTRTDVYSLGVVLYELLSGELPFSPKDLRAAGWHEIQRKLREDQPPKPSTRLTTLGVDPARLLMTRRTSLPGLLRVLRGDLDWIVLKAMAKEPERRYDSATALATDLARFLKHEPVLAGPPSFGYRLRKFAQRYRGQVVAAVVVFATLLGGVVGTTVFAVRAERHLGNFNRLALVVRLDNAERSERDLYPPGPELVGPLQSWLTDTAEPLCEAIPRVRATIASLEALETERGVDRPGREADRFLLRTLRDVLTDLEAFADEQDGTVGRARRRLAWARRVHASTVEAYRSRWDETIVAVSSDPRYRGLRLRPVVGLIPLGADPGTGLQEFYHPRSGDSDAPVPERIRGASGIGMRDERGLVFVLLPGGSEQVGSQREDPAQPNYYERVKPDEPLQSVEVAPFLLSKYEVTQAQWFRLSDGDAPSYYGSGTVHFGETITDSNPVEQVSWIQCTELCRRHGMVLPTQTQWEYACRAGTDTPWSTGADEASLDGFANLADRSLTERVPQGYGWGPGSVPWDDGHVLHAPVGRFRPNGFGLFDVHGNVWEWSRDPDGYGKIGSRATRGGGFRMSPYWARSAVRHPMPPLAEQSNMGLRPAIELPPPPAPSGR